MRIVGESASDECHGGGVIKDYRTDSKVTLKFLDYLSRFGEMQILKGIKKPFYSFDREYYFTIKGIVGRRELKVIYRTENRETAHELLEKILAKYDPKNVRRSVEAAKKLGWESKT